MKRRSDLPRGSHSHDRHVLTRRGFVGAGLGLAASGLLNTGDIRASEPVIINGIAYDAYIPTATKPAQYFWYTCEFDAAWVVLETYGIPTTFEEQLAIVGWAPEPIPYYEETAEGVLIHGGDPTVAFCGDYQHSFLARMRSPAMRKCFDHHGLPSRPIRSRAGITSALRRGRLVWMKVTVDFKEFTPATWVTPDDRRYPTAFTNDHAVVVMGFNQDVVVIRDVLGPTDTNWDRAYEYEVPWPLFEAAAAAHGWDGLAVAPPAVTT